MLRIANPNDIHRTMKRDSSANIGVITEGDTMCLLATLADGSRRTVGDFVIGRSDPWMGEMLDNLLKPVIGESGVSVNTSPVVKVEIVHSCRVLLGWKEYPEGRYWFRESVHPGNYKVIVSQIEVQYSSFDPRIGMDRELVADGWVLL